MGQEGFLPEGRVVLGGPPGRPGMVGRPSPMAGRDQEERKGLGVPPEGLGGLEGLPGEPGRAGRPSWSAGMGRESLLEGWQDQEGSRWMGGVRKTYKRTWRNQEAPL